MSAYKFPSPDLLGAGELDTDIYSRNGTTELSIYDFLDDQLRYKTLPQAHHHPGWGSHLNHGHVECLIPTKHELTLRHSISGI